MEVIKKMPFLMFKANSDGGYACRKHSHKEVSLGYIKEGRTTVTLCGRTFDLKPGDIILIPAQTVHLCVPDERAEFRFTMIYFDPEWWTETFGIPSKTFLPAAAAASAEIKAFLSSVPDGEKEITETGILSILTTAVRSLVITKDRTDAEDDKVHTFHRTISTLPETHRSIDEYAEDLGISKYELIRKYAKTYGLTPHADKINMRIQRAILLFESPLSMTEIAYECGFSDQSHFIRCFKQYSGMQPGEYRNAILSNSH